VTLAARSRQTRAITRRSRTTYAVINAAGKKNKLKMN
jgi:hypothetical protein